jgi:hypothetical protein
MILSDLKKITQPIFYVTPTLTRAIGLEDVLPNYHIVCIDDSPLIELLLKRGVKVFSLERKIGYRNPIFRSTSQLLRHPQVSSYIKNQSDDSVPNILFFKPSVAIDKICKEQGYRKLGNSAFLNELFENKILFTQFLTKAGLPQPKGEIGDLSEFEFDRLALKYGSKLVVQFGRGWAGSTTFVIEEKDDFLKIQHQYPGRKVKVTQFINGPTVLNNACISGQKVLISPPAVQITAPAGFTSRPLGSCGRAWPAVLASKQKKKIYELTQAVGSHMRKLGYRGFFGLDFLIKEATGQVFISENNARLTASAPFYTKLELMMGVVPLIAFHLLEFLKISYSPEKTGKMIKAGTEIVLRNTHQAPIEIRGEFTPGVYGFWPKTLKFLRPGASAADLKTKKETLIVTANKGKIIGREIDLLKINSLDCLLDAKGQLKKWVVDLVYKVKSGLKLRGQK